MSETVHHPLELTVMDLGGGQGLPKKALGGAAHMPHGSAEALARKHILHVLGQLPEDPAASLTNATVPGADILTEKPEHRLVVMLHCQGKRPKEIATLTEYSEVHIRTILAQPWARRQAARMLEESDTRQLVEQRLSSAALDSVDVLLQLRDDPKTPPNVRASVCNQVLDRFLGKAVQPIQAVKPINGQDDEEINGRLAELEARSRDLIGRPKVRDITVGPLETVAIPDKPRPAA